ncbi:hypothetical protein RIF29_41387 [Crotalaria pallida]|uniref:UBA domain-containing protein n=1 Tax=Crotalaria pallida TaxID=3830 RepID=A0AAN9E7Y1_CROPI
MQGSSSTLATHPSNACVWIEKHKESANGSSFKNSSNPCKSKARPVSVGTVSGVIGKDYVRSTSSANGSYGVTKPVKLDAKARAPPPMIGVWREKTKPTIVKHNQLHQDMEDFLFNMLGDGFNLDRDRIKEVLDSCGYDMQKSMKSLLDGSIAASGKRTAAVGDSDGKFTYMKPKSELSSSSEIKAHNANHLGGDGNTVSSKAEEVHGKHKQREDLQKEIMTALFTAREPPEEPPRRTVKDLNKNSRYGVVSEPLTDSMEEYNIEEYKIDMDFSLQNVVDADNEEDYRKVRKAVKEYRVTMSEYYKAAVEAFAKGDQIRAEKLLDQGHFFLKKAHEADEESSRMILETSNTETQEILLDLHDIDPKEARSLLKTHVSSLSGIPSFEYLKVILEANGEDSSKGSRRRVVLKLLEKESIKWVEGENAGTILIPLGSIEREKLSFV